VPAVIRCSRSLLAFDHPYASGEARRIAEPGTVVLRAITEVEERLTAPRTSFSVPPEPDHAWVDGWLHRSNESFWATL
jgi:uncharacterized protein